MLALIAGMSIALADQQTFVLVTVESKRQRVVAQAARLPADWEAGLDWAFAWRGRAYVVRYENDRYSMRAYIPDLPSERMGDLPPHTLHRTEVGLVSLSESQRFEVPNSRGRLYWHLEQVVLGVEDSSVGTSGVDGGGDAPLAAVALAPQQ